MKNTPVYFVTMDIEKCYDNVDVQKLNRFLIEYKESLLEDNYQIVNCFSIKKSNRH